MNFNNKFNYQIYDIVDNRWIFADLSKKKYQFYFIYKTNKESNSQLPKSWRAFRYIILFLFFITFFITDNNNLYNKYYTTPQIPIITFRSSINISSDSLDIAFEKINNKKYNDAINILNKLKNKDDQVIKTNSYFYMGISYQEMMDYKMAIINYKEILNNPDNIYFIETQWCLGLCYLNINDYKNALKQFKNVANSESCYKLSALELIKKLK